MKNRFNDGDFPEDLYGMRDDDEENHEYQDNYEESENPDEILQALELDRKELNSKILFRTIRSLERSWFWWLRSEKSQTRIIERTYRRNLRLISMGEWEYVKH